VTITSRFTLRAGQRYLEVTTSFDNPCRNHRLRVVFPTWLQAEKTYAEAAFDVIGRDIQVKKTSPYYGRPNPQYPMYRFVDITDGENGLAIVNTGIREYEAPDTPERPIAITLLRAFTFRHAPIFGRWEVYPEMDLAQCIGYHEWTYALYPHRGDWTNGCFREAENLNLPLEAAQAGPHPGRLRKFMSFLEIEGENLQITAFKRGQDRPSSYIVRLFNPTDRTVPGILKLFKPIKQAWLTNLNEERLKRLPVKGNGIRLTIGKKRIQTVEISA